MGCVSARDGIDLSTGQLLSFVFGEKKNVFPDLNGWKILHKPPGICQVIKKFPECLSINSYQDDGYELVDKNSWRIGMMRDCRVFYAYKFYKQRALWCNPAH